MAHLKKENQRGELMSDDKYNQEPDACWECYSQVKLCKKNKRIGDMMSEIEIIDDKAYHVFEEIDQCEGCGKAPVDCQGANNCDLLVDNVRYAEYSEGVAPDGAAILKDGHVMFPQDIVMDLNRKSFLEENKVALEKCLKSVQYSLHCMEQAGAFENNVLDQKMVKGILAKISKSLAI